MWYQVGGRCSSATSEIYIYIFLRHLGEGLVQFVVSALARTKLPLMFFPPLPYDRYLLQVRIALCLSCCSRSCWASRLVVQLRQADNLSVDHASDYRGNASRNITHTRTHNARTHTHSRTRTHSRTHTFTQARKHVEISTIVLFSFLFVFRSEI